MKRAAKTCAICESGVRVVDFKDERTLQRFLTERGKILPARLSGTCARHQRWKSGSGSTMRSVHGAQSDSTQRRICVPAMMYDR